jgi:hypothetical protein
MLTRSLDTSIVLSGPVFRSPQDDAGLADNRVRQLAATNFVITDEYKPVDHSLQLGGMPARRERYNEAPHQGEQPWSDGP